MDQISPPMRIVLAVAVVFLAAYMLVLKPKGDSGTAATPTPATAEAPAAASASDANKAHTGLGKAVEAAHGAADSTEKAQNAAAGETTATTPSTTSAAPATTTTTPATESTPAAKPADESLAGLPGWLQKSIDHKVVAILFTNNKAADDRRTIKALKHAYTAHGKVVTHVVPITKISKYRPVAQGVDVAQSPTLMVIDRDRHAQSLVGYANVDTINQAVIDGLLATDKPIRHVKYLKTVQRECRQVFNQAVLGENPGTSLKGYRKNVDALITTMAASLGTLRNAPVSAGYKPLSKQVNRYFASELAIGREVRSKAILSKTVDGLKVEQIVARNDKLANRVQLELNAVGVDACN